MPKFDMGRWVAGHMHRVGRNNMLDQIMLVVRHFKGERVREYHGCIYVAGNCSLPIKGAEVKLSYISLGELPGTQYEVYWGDKLVFAARRSIDKNAFKDTDPRRIVRLKSGEVVRVDEFHDGDWVQALDLGRWVRKERRRAKWEQKAQDAKAPRESDARLMERFSSLN